MKEKIIEILKDSAWYDGRKKDVGYIYDDLKKAGLTSPNDVILKFIEEFESVYLSFKGDNGQYIEIYFNVDRGIENTYVELHPKLESALKEKLVPIGSFGDNIGSIEMSFSGKIYMIVPDDGVFLLGDTFEDAMDVIIEQKQITRVFDFD